MITLHGMNEEEFRGFRESSVSDYAEDLMKPMDVAGTLAFMATGAAKGIVGEIIYCDGGSASLFHNTKYL